MSKKKKTKKDIIIENLRLSETSNILMYQHFADVSKIRGKALTVLIPKLDQETLTDILAEYYDLKRITSEIDKEQLRKILEVHGTVSNYLRSLGEFKDVPIDEKEVKKK